MILQSVRLAADTYVNAPGWVSTEPAFVLVLELADLVADDIRHAANVVIQARAAGVPEDVLEAAGVNATVLDVVAQIEEGK